MDMMPPGMYRLTLRAELFGDRRYTGTTSFPMPPARQVFILDCGEEVEVPSDFDGPTYVRGSLDP